MSRTEPSVRAFFFFADSGEDRSADDALPVREGEPLELLSRLDNPGDFVGFIDADENTLQIRFEPKGKPRTPFWCEIPVPAERGSYGVALSRPDVHELVAKLPERFLPKAFPTFTFESW